MKILCPVKLPQGVCRLCPFSKEGLCDFPYKRDMILSDIIKISRKKDTIKFLKERAI